MLRGDNCQPSQGPTSAAQLGPPSPQVLLSLSCPAQGAPHLNQAHTGPAWGQPQSLQCCQPCPGHCPLPSLTLREP